jgi:GNAT superfamily N-acetyltransferase
MVSPFYSLGVTANPPCTRTQSFISDQPMLEVHPATLDRFEDLRSVLGPKNQSAQACWCLTYRLTNAENSSLSGEARPMRLQQFCEEKCPPGVLAYLDGAAAGWSAVGPRTKFERLKRSKTIQFMDDTPVWSIVCLVVKAGFRRKGVARSLIEGAVTFAASHGARMIEAYPIETNGDRDSASLAFTGTTALFGAAGFTKCEETQAKSAGKVRVIMRRAVEAATATSLGDASEEAQRTAK